MLPDPYSDPLGPLTTDIAPGYDHITSAHFCSMRGPHFCSMKITEDARKFALEQGITEDAAIGKGSEQEATEFTEKGFKL